MKELGRFDCSTGISNIIYTDGTITVRTATVKDMLFIDKLQKENSYAVGFIQKTIWDDYVFGGLRNFVVFIAEINNDHVGYVLITPGKKMGSYGKIQQIAIREDARRMYYGNALINACRQFCNYWGITGFTLRCRADLDANKFWKNIGFEQYGTWEKGKVNHVGFKASNDIFLWKINLNVIFQTLF